MLAATLLIAVVAMLVVSGADVTWWKFFDEVLAPIHKLVAIVTGLVAISTGVVALVGVAKWRADVKRELQKLRT